MKTKELQGTTHKQLLWHTVCSYTGQARTKNLTEREIENAEKVFD
jgi:hypothetical protein